MRNPKPLRSEVGALIGLVAVRLDGELLQAWTWTGDMIWLNSGSGEEIKRVFTK